MIVLAFTGMVEHPYAIVSFGLCLFVTVTVFSEFWKGAFAIRAKNNIGLLPAIVELTHRNTRRYGGYVVHMAIVFMFIGFTGAAFNQNKTVEVSPGNSFAIGHYNLKVTDQQDGENDNYVWRRLSIDVTSQFPTAQVLGLFGKVQNMSQLGEIPLLVMSVRKSASRTIWIAGSMTWTGKSKSISKGSISVLEKIASRFAGMPTTQIEPLNSHCESARGLSAGWCS